MMGHDSAKGYRGDGVADHRHSAAGYCCAAASRMGWTASTRAVAVAISVRMRLVDLSMSCNLRAMGGQDCTR
jgi:hypothetical protein